ncbi:MAG: restriction endonuclease [Anaerolinea sp.]|nr:restriction endonuclease [Anaerolinea sp.]
MPNMDSRLTLTPNLPTNKQVMAFLRVMDGENYQTYRLMVNRITDQIGNPQEVVDWSDPNVWIPMRLKGVEQTLAMKIWRNSNYIVNPRHTRGCWYFIKNHDLILENPNGLLEITEQGKEFLNNNLGEITAFIDKGEGILNTLQILSEHNPGRKNEILPDYSLFCDTFTNYQSKFVQSVSLYDRIKNLLDRGLILRRGVFYELTDSGIEYLQKYSHLVIGRAVSTKQSQLQKITTGLSQEARKQLFDTLTGMNPIKFEHVIKSLLEEMGYSNVIVTTPSNDKGVDVIGDIELGISSVKEVVQVKRHSASVIRPVLDQLRGVLPMFNAIRGTIITTGKFAKGTITAALDPRGAPITLIDGEKLVDLLMEYEIGITKRTIEFFEYDGGKLEEFISDTEALEEGNA